jgi:hypothetical protein
MNFSSKLTVAMATAAIFCPLAASANPVSTGSTAAAVSIKFQECKCGPTSGNFSIDPGRNANGGGTGVQELSAAVATGETKAKANAASDRSGTKANAYGYSAPVSFSYRSYSDLSNRQYRSEYSQNSEYKEEAAVEFASNQKKNRSQSESESEKVALEKNGGRGYYDDKGKFVEYRRSETEESQSASNSERNLSRKSSERASAIENSSGTESKDSTRNKNGTSYSYTGSSAGLSFIPAIVK